VRLTQHDEWFKQDILSPSLERVIRLLDWVDISGKND
jgi:hypothetical protein